MKIQIAAGAALLVVGLNALAYVSASMHHDFTDLTDDDGNGVADSLETYLSTNGISLPPDYDAWESDLDGDAMSDAGEWVLGTDPLAVEEHQSTTMEPGTNGNVVLNLQLPAYWGYYAEIFGRDTLLYGNWELVEDWIPTYGEDELLYYDVVRSNTLSYFFMIFDATLDLDGDGYSDHMEHFISLTDPYEYNDVDSDLDGMHDWWELKLFGDLNQTLDDDYDLDGILNRYELLPGHPPILVTDPSMFSSDNDALGDGEMYGVYGLPTDPWNGDVDPPSASILWPTNNYVFIP